METLSEKRRRFTRDLSDLIAYAFASGYEVQLEEVVRRKTVAEENATTGKGIANSLHLIGLAADLSLFVHGEYQQDSSAYRQLGVYWEQMEGDHCWGGRFKDKQGNPAPDGGHFSISHDGRK